MKSCWILVLLCCCVPAFAVHPQMERATVEAMRKAPCTEVQSTGSGVLSGILNGPPSDNQCIEYELSTEKVSYVIRPRRVVLLLLGRDVFIQLAGGELLLRAEDAVKDIRCTVLSMTLRSSDGDRQDRSRTASSHCYESGREVRCPDAP